MRVDVARMRREIACIENAHGPGFDLRHFVSVAELRELLRVYEAWQGATEVEVREVGGSLIASSLPVMHNLQVGQRVRLVSATGGEGG